MPNYGLLQYVFYTRRQLVLFSAKNRKLITIFKPEISTRIFIHTEKYDNVFKLPGQNFFKG